MKASHYSLRTAVLLLAISGTAQAADDSYLSLAIGLTASSGKYGTSSTTDTVSVPVSAYYESGDWSWKLTVPYLQVTGDGSVVVSGGRGGRRGATTTTTTVATRTTQSGMGDVVAMSTYCLLEDEAGATGLDLTARIKFGTASGTMGSGKNDYAAQLTGYTAFGDLSPSLTLGYEMLGSSPNLPLDNVAYGTLGLNYAMTGQSSIGADYWYSQRASATGYEQREASVYLSGEIGDELYLRGYVMQGLSDGSPDSGYGLTLSAGF